MNTLTAISFHLWETDQDLFVRRFGESFQETGFAIISDHPIPNDLIENGYRVVRKFFGLSDNIKTRYLNSSEGFARGYTPFKVENAKGHNVPDLKEFWHTGRNEILSTPSVSEVADFDAVTRELYDYMDEFGQTLMQAICLYLGEKKTHLDNKISQGNSLLRLLHYPPISDRPELGAIRAAAHEDINLITLLLGAEEAGLQLQDRQLNWIPINPPKGTIVINAGDMLSRWTAGKVPSTTHRVVNPSTGRAGFSRYSMPFFLHPNPDFVISQLPQCIEKGQAAEADITADEFLKIRLREIGLLKQ